MQKKLQTPSYLASLSGARAQGRPINVIKGGKAPKRRYNIGDSFRFEDGIWTIIYMYRLRENPNVWQHCLEETKAVLEGSNRQKIAAGFEAIGAGATTPRIVYDLFYNWSDANVYFSDIYRNGSQTTKSTQQLNSLSKI